MNEAIAFLRENPVQYLATVGRDGRAKCRPFMFAGELDGKLEVSVASPAYAWIRLSGKAVFEDSREAKEMCMGNPIVKSQYQTADNPIFVVFYLEEARAVLADFSGNPPREYQF